MKNENKKINTPDEYILNQPVERQEVLKKLRQVINSGLPKGFAETIQYNMISYVVPHDLYREGYHVNPKEPLPFLALANQKGYIALYHMGMYMDEPLMKWFSESYADLDIGKLDMGKSCIRFKNMDKIPYHLIAELCSKMSVDEYIEVYKLSRKNPSNDTKKAMTEAEKIIHDPNTTRYTTFKEAFDEVMTDNKK